MRLLLAATNADADATGVVAHQAPPELAAGPVVATCMAPASSTRAPGNSCYVRPRSDLHLQVALAIPTASSYAHPKSSN